MTPDEATAQFREADKLYRGGKFNQAMRILDTLNAEFPSDRNLMYAQARTLGKIGREDEALTLCDRLVSDFGYSRAARLQVKLLKSMTEQIDADAAAAPPLPPQSDSASESDSPEDEDVDEKPRRFQIKPIRLILLIVLITLTLTKLIHPFLGIGIFVAYFVVKWVIGAAVKRLFMAPFKMKAQALAGATVSVHDVTSIPNPDPDLIGDDDEDDSEGPELRYVTIDVTVEPPERTEGFTHWEPGELSLAPQSVQIKGLDDLDHCFNVVDVKVFNDGVEEDDEGYKYNGPARIKLLVGLPHGADAYQFVYYTEAFGMVEVPA